ncbi:hypothetical protein [Enterococcus sp. AZ177]|uniref:hypothetical protein n=1 Tax=unclassified Enterococcus TaxID=2608891 RepID=UPI003D2FCC32
MENETPYLVCTTLGGQECYFVELDGVKPHFSDDLKEACFMSEEDAVRLRDILNEKTDAYFEVLEVNIVD